MGRLAVKYDRRRPEGTLLYQLIAENIQTFFTSVESRPQGRIFPAYVKREFDAYLKCGILDHGFLRLQCTQCEKSHLIGFSCKKRGFCPSCGARRMCETAAHLVDHVLPYAPFRQYVVSFPFALRYWLSSRPRLTTKMVRLINDAVTKFIKTRAKDMGFKNVQTGAVTFLQRFGGFLNLNTHAHVLFLDGFYHKTDESSYPKLVAIEPPTEEEVALLAEDIAGRVIRCLQREGFLPKNEELLDAEEQTERKDNLRELFPPMAESMKASTEQMIAFGENAGQRVRLIGKELGKGFGAIGDKAKKQGRRSATVNGLSLHCNVAVAADKRPHLEKLLRYMGRSSLSLSRLTLDDNGQVNYQLKSPFKGKTHIVLSPMEMMEKLCALVPPPKMHLVRFHGVFAPHAKWRPHVTTDSLAKLIDEKCGVVPAAKKPKRELSQEEKYTWASILKRIYGVDMTICPDCQGALVLRAKVVDPAKAKELLSVMGIPSRAPPAKPSRVVTLIRDE